MFAEAANCQYVMDYVAIHGESLADFNPYSMILESKVYNNTALMYMWDKWNTHYRNTLGANLWAVYNTLTDWGTHVQGRTNNVANIQHTRGVKIQKVLDHHRFGFNKAA